MFVFGLEMFDQLQYERRRVFLCLVGERRQSSALTDREGRHSRGEKRGTNNKQQRRERRSEESDGM